MDQSVLEQQRRLLNQPPHPRPDGADRYTIGEVAEHTGLSVHTLRWYERIGLLDQVERSHRGQRLYGNRDLEWLALVGKLRLIGMPVADMVAYADMVRRGPDTARERRELLSGHRDQVAEQIDGLKSTLAVLDWKIDLYDRMASESENGHE